MAQHLVTGYRSANSNITIQKDNLKYKRRMNLNNNCNYDDREEQRETE